MIDRPALAAFLRHRREALQPEDVGLPRGPRRRTGGLRREEVAESHRLLVYTAVPGSENDEKLRLLAVVGADLQR